MNKKFKIVMALGLFVPMVLFAAKSDRVQKKTLGAENSWQDKFNINEHKPGKYNILVTAEDQAGNTSIAGPFNMFIDPESDLPVTGITNPVENMRVPGNLNIVGTCVDDDKVTEVWLILDGDEDHPVKAEGTEFWGYFLTTTELFEGPHTIEVYGIDDGNPEAYKNENGEIDTSKVIPKTGHRTKVTWQLDRRAPVTVVDNHQMGDLVAGKINLAGHVTDGNGIKLLEYSLNGGETYKEVSIKEQKYAERTEDGLLSQFNFEIPIDTREFEDGVATCWFRATDNAGSVGRYAFLYFIDNTNPDVKIITPEKNKSCNGVFTVAGYAKDAIGIKSLSWQWGTDKDAPHGDFELTPGNPYWVKEINTIGNTKKAEDFIITATDIMGNTVVLKQTIPLNQEEDKPLVSINYPSEGLAVECDDGLLYVRGMVSDDDGAVSVTYKLDDGEETTLDCTGVFYAPISGELAYGPHKITAYAKDRYGIIGNPVISTFISKGPVPSYQVPQYREGTEISDFMDGRVVNPEAGGTYEITVESECGLKNVTYNILWGSNSSKSDSVALKGGEKTATVSIPFAGDDIPWGVARFEVVSEDVYGRKCSHTSIAKILDLTKMHTNTPGVFFDDSVVSDDGSVLADSKNPLTGYFAGGKISSIALEPSQKSINASFDGHIITLSSDSDSEPFVVSVTTDAGAVYKSRSLTFKAPSEKLVLTLDNEDYSAERGVPFEFSSKDLKLDVSGKVSAQNASLRYRILAVKANLLEDVFLTSSEPVSPSEFKSIDIKRGSWSIDSFGFDNFVDGVSVIEILAETADGQKASQAILVKKIPLAPASSDFLDDKGNPMQKAEPKLYWLEGFDYYGVCVYQGQVDNEFKYVRSSTIRADQAPIEFTTSPLDADDAKKVPVYKATPLAVVSPSIIKPRIVNIDGAEYKSGMDVAIDRVIPKDEIHTVLVSIKSNSQLKNVAYVLDGETAPGGKSTQEGNVAPVEISYDDELKEYEYEASIPLRDLPARITKLNAVVSDVRGYSVKVNGTFNVLRNHVILDSESRIYWTSTEDTVYNDELKAYVLNDGTQLVGYANVTGKVTAALEKPVEGLEAAADGNIVKIRGYKEGVYNNVVLVATAEDGGIYKSPAVTLYVDSEKPSITVTAPLAMSFQKDVVTVTGNVADASGIKLLSYTIQDAMPDVLDKNGKVVETREISWTDASFSKTGDFSFDINLKETEDGYVPVTLKAVDKVGKISYYNTVIHKDVTPPEVTVLLPDEGMVVNGENTILFKVSDGSYIKDMHYISASEKQKLDFDIFKLPEEVPVKQAMNEETGVEEPVSLRFDSLRTMNSSLPNMRVGTENAPIDNGMKFTFCDANGNVTTVDKWGFTVDEESDKPVTEIHLPEDNQVITTDFTISGVVYDDDGACKTFYKIDKGEYQLMNEELASSFKVNIPLLSMTDNEHSITAYSVDINGVKGDEVVRNFRVSLEEPKGGMTEPEISKTVRGTVVLKGWASDKNDISRVQVSIDNGASYNDAEGTTSWSYEFDTNVIQDGTHVVFIKIWDCYQISALYSSLINVDNTPPELRLELPLDGAKTAKNIFLSGQTTDNIGLIDLTLRIRSLDGKTIPDRLALRTLEPDEIITQVVDVSELSNGLYNVEITGVDAAGNLSRVSRNVEVDKTRPLAKVSLLYPLNGEHVASDFNIFGTAYSSKEDPIDYIELYVDSRKMEECGKVALTDSGYFKFNLQTTLYPLAEERCDEQGNKYAVQIGSGYTLASGRHTYQTVAITKSGKKIVSNEQTFLYAATGPWVTLDNFTYGDFAVKRPILKGHAGYTLSIMEESELKKKDIDSEYKKEILKKKIKRVYLSFDNGKTYVPVSKEGKGDWEYRVENLDIPAGYHFMLVKAEMLNGENAVTRCLVQVDRTAPFIKLISPGESGRYNQELLFQGLSSDDVNLSNVTLALRKGDKASYEIPGFIQGLYFDASFWGSTLYSVGLGLTAFDGAVKVQASFGQFTQSQRDSVNDVLGKDKTDGRFGGNVFSGKIIAQLLYLPFRYFLGRDWDWLSATVAVGANFSYFTETGAGIAKGESVPQMLSAALIQVEFPRVTFSEWKRFKTWAFYTEPQLWFIPSDVAGGDAKKYVYTTSIGIRTSVF